MTKPDMYQKSIHRTELDGPLQGADRMTLPFVPTPKQPLIISASEIGDFLRCRLRWNWKYRVGLQTKAFGAPRAIGTLVSIGKEAWYHLPAHKRTVKRMDKIARHLIMPAVLKAKGVQADEKSRELSRAMLVGFAEWVRGDHEHSDESIGKVRVYPEHAFSLPLVADGSILIRGKIDERFKPSIYTKVMAMDETKTKTDISFDMLDMDEQMTVYLWAMSQEYPKMRRYIAWRTVLRRQMPGPRVRAALFGREMIERTDEELAMWLVDIRRKVRDMMDAAIYPTKTDRCKWDCDFYNLCLVRANKRDLKNIIRSEYTIKT